MTPDHLLWLARAQLFERDAHEILSGHEDANVSRVIKLEQAYALLDTLSVRQDDLMRQALRCAENELYRAAHVMAWAACMDFIQEKLSADNLASLRAVRPKWQGKDISEMAEYVPERQLVDVLQNVGLASKNEVNALVGLLQHRNECAHPSDYLPAVNETLGYIAEVMQRIKLLAPKCIT